MSRIRIYRNPDCAKCARYARMHERLDWFGRIENSTAAPSTGPLAMGEVVVEELATRRLLRGAEAAERIAREIPAYAPFRLLLKLPVVRAMAEREMAGCAGSCAPPARRV